MDSGYLRLLAVFAWLLLVCTGPAATAVAAAETQAASPPPAIETLTREQVQALLARLSDGEVRTLLLQQLDKLAAPEAPTPSNTDAVLLIADDAQTIRYRLGSMVAAAPDLPYAGLFIVDQLTHERDPIFTREVLLGLALVLGSGMIAEWLFRRLFRGLGTRISMRTPRSEFGRLGLLMVRAVIDVMALAVFVLGGVLLYFIVHPDEDLTRHAFWAIFLAIVGVRAASIIARLILAPDQADLRLPTIDDTNARSLYRWLIVMIALVGAASTFGLLLVYLNLPEPLRLLVSTLLLWLIVLAFIGFIWLKRRALARLTGLQTMEEPGDPPPSLLAGNWYVFLTIALVAMGLFATISRLLTGETQAVHFLGTLLLLAAIPVADGLLRMIVRRLAPPTLPATLSATTRGKDAPMPAAGDYAPVILHNLRIVLGVVVVLVFGQIWDINLERLAASGLGNRIAESLFTIAVALILASAVWGVIKTAINRHVPNEEIDPQALVEGEGTGTGMTRVQTLLPILRKFLLVTLIVIVGMIVISALGVDIGPLLAGAGVVGIAVGFGAQALVRDIFSGIFFLIDDAFRIGEYIDVGTAKGMVERISIRSLRLRHHLGQINTIPFGELKHVTNFSRDWVIMKLEVRVPFDTDIEKVRKLVKRIGQDLLADPDHGANFLQPLKSQGVHRMDDSAFILRVKFMAKPGEQFILRREVYRRLQETFLANGIKFAPRRVIVDSPGSVAEAAAAALASEPPQTSAKPG